MTSSPPPCPPLSSGGDDSPENSIRGGDFSGDGGGYGYGEAAGGGGDRRLAAAVPAVMDRRRRNRAASGFLGLHETARKGQRRRRPKRHGVVLRPNQIQASAGIQQESARREASPFEEEVPKRRQQARRGKDVTFKSPHDHATFEISNKIWSEISGAKDTINFNPLAEDNKSTPKARKRQRPQAQPKTGTFVKPVAQNHNHASNVGVSNCGNCNVQGRIEETVKSCISPLLLELTSDLARGLLIQLSFGGPLMNLSYGGGEGADEQWRKQ